MTGAPVPEGCWVLAVRADRRYYASVVARQGPDIAAVSFPSDHPSAEIPLTGSEVHIGRRRPDPAAPVPEVDLAGPPLDPGVSHRHAVLRPTGGAGDPAGGWSVTDAGSTNGTTINDATDPIAADTTVALRPDDRVHVGAFTTLVLRRAGGRTAP